MCVAHTFEVVLQAKVAAVVRMGDVDFVHCRRIDSIPNLKPRLYLHLWGGVGLLLLLLIIVADLRLVRGGGACRRLGCR